MRDAADARRLLRAGSFPDPTTPRPETPTMPTPTMPPDLYAAVQYLLDVAREKANEAEALLERHYADASDPGYYRESEYPKGFDGTWNRIFAAKDTTHEAASDFRRYAPKTD